jgi:hypothetical protein
MTAEISAKDSPDERVQGRSWTVRLDPAERGSAAVRFSCDRPACPAQRLPTAAEGRAFAVAHLNAHLRAARAPRPEAYCACRADGCHGHTDASAPRGPRDTGPVWRCGGAVVFAVVADRAGRWWRALECCARCAAAHPTARVVAGAPGAARAESRPDRPGPGALHPQFSHSPSSTFRPESGGAGGRLPGPRPSVPRASAGPRRPRWQGRIAQRPIPEGLRPTSLRDELVALGDEFRAYQKRPEPDLALLAELHARKARAFDLWADIVGDVGLRGDARRAEQAAATARMQYRHRTGDVGDDEEDGVARLLTKPRQWESARIVLAHVRDHAPLPGPQARLLTLLFTLRSARAGSGNVTGQDLTALPLDDPEELVRQLTDLGWLLIPGTPADLLASRPESAVPVTVPSLTPGPDGAGAFSFGKVTRARVSGWTQRVVSDRKLRKGKTPAAVRLLALSLAAHTTTDGRLGPGGEGVEVETLASLCATEADEFGPLVERLTVVDWLSDAEITGDRLTGRLTERVLPFTCPLLPPGFLTGPED